MTTIDSVPDLLAEDITAEQIVTAEVWLARHPYAEPYGGADANVLADSLAPTGDRLTTMAVRIALTVWAELLTHKDLSRASGSSRAVPVKRRVVQALTDPFAPDRFPLAQSGMQPAGYSEPGTALHEACVRRWFAARDAAVHSALGFFADGVHKEIANRVIAPYLWNDGIVTATTWERFYELRLADSAQRQIRQAAEAMSDAMAAHSPRPLYEDQWHLPLVGFDGDERFGTGERIQLSVARVARTSYLTHDGRRDPKADFRLYGDLRNDKHLSPFEMAAHPAPGRWANLTGFKQARWYIERSLELPVVETVAES